MFSKILILKLGVFEGQLSSPVLENQLYLSVQSPRKHFTSNSTGSRGRCRRRHRTRLQLRTHESPEGRGKPPQFPFALLTTVPEALEYCQGFRSDAECERKSWFVPNSRRTLRFLEGGRLLPAEEIRKLQLEKHDSPPDFSPAASASPHVLSHVEEERHPRDTLGGAQGAGPVLATVRCSQAVI